MSAIEELRRLEEAWAAAVEGNDVESAEAILAEDFVLTSSGGMGEWVPRDDWLAALERIDTRAFGISDVEPRVFGDVAVVRLLGRWEASSPDRDLTGDYALVDVFTRPAGAWQVSWRISRRLTES
ncbi:MAG TPA: nuclear transport factor 2 family protein [Gaiellaceae bacterium]